MLNRTPSKRHLSQHQSSVHRSPSHSPLPHSPLRDSVEPLRDMREFLECSGERQNTKYINAPPLDDRFPHINVRFYTDLTRGILRSAYPRTCPDCKKPMDRYISTRQTAIRCGLCNYQGSLTAYTPVHHFKLPLWMFSYLLLEQIQRFPQVLNASEIQRKLGVAKNTATLLKRRLQLFHSDLIPAI